MTRTLTQFLIDERRKHPSATGELNSLILSLAAVCKSIAAHVNQGALPDELHERVDTFATAAFRGCVAWGGPVAAMLSGAMEHAYVPPGGSDQKYLLAFEALDGSSNADINVPVGSIFSILRAPSAQPTSRLEACAFLQPGSVQVAAGYAIYGPATMFVLSVGSGVHGFTLQRSIGEFILTHPNLRVPNQSSEFAINASNSRFWEPPIRRYVRECLAGATGPRGCDFNMRWIASLVAEAHRILVRGGIFLYPRHAMDRNQLDGLRLLYACNPIAFLVDQAGGRASTGREPILGVQPSALHQQAHLIFGSRDEVERIERYHAEDRGDSNMDLPLFHPRGLFRDPVATR